MSYARFAPDSDVYVFLAFEGHLECCGCTLRDDADIDANFTTTNAMLAHLEAHAAAGHKIPTQTIPALVADGPENDAWIKWKQAPPVATEGQGDTRDTPSLITVPAWSSGDMLARVLEATGDLATKYAGDRDHSGVWWTVAQGGHAAQRLADLTLLTNDGDVHKSYLEIARLLDEQQGWLVIAWCQVTP